MMFVIFKLNGTAQKRVFHSHPPQVDHFESQEVNQNSGKQTLQSNLDSSAFQIENCFKHPVCVYFHKLNPNSYYEENLQLSLKLVPFHFAGPILCNNFDIQHSSKKRTLIKLATQILWDCFLPNLNSRGVIGELN